MYKKNKVIIYTSETELIQLLMLKKISKKELISKNSMKRNGVF